jgi:hypothetical protein
MSQPNQSFKSFSDFYPFYLNEHRNKISKLVHFIGTCGIIILLLIVATTGRLNLLWFVPICGYGFAWIGHFFFEKNRPATFKYPFYSLRGDFLMFWHLLTGQLSFADNAQLQITKDHHNQG